MEKYKLKHSVDITR